MTGNAITILKFPVALAMLCLLSAFSSKDAPHCKFKFDHFHALKKIPEPSDIVFDSSSGHLFIVSDHGKLFECDTLGTIIRKAPEEGLDFEGVEIKDSFIYVSDETPRKVYKYRKNDLSLVKVYSVTWGGAMNRAFESIAYNYAKKCFVLISQQPPVIVEYDEDFKELNKQPFRKTRDISGARWYNGYIYLLSNLDAGIYKCDPRTYEVLRYYTINVLNPEGIGFDGSGKVMIVSDDLQRLYYFDNLPATKQ